MKRLLIAAAAMTVFAAPLVSSRAADGLPGAMVRSDAATAESDRRARHEQWCKANPEKCREIQARREQCQADPEKCRAEMQARREARQAQCKADPEKCRAEMQARREQWCKANPEKCRELQARREQCKADPEKCRAEQQARVAERFKQADTNGDGRLTRDEARKGMPMVARHFDLIDANKDGVVTWDELQAARAARGGPRKTRGTTPRPGARSPA